MTYTCHRFGCAALELSKVIPYAGVNQLRPRDSRSRSVNQIHVSAATDMAMIAIVDAAKFAQHYSDHW